MKPGLIYIASFFLFQLATAQGNYRSVEPVKASAMIAKTNRTEIPHNVTSRAYTKINTTALPTQKITPTNLFPIKSSPEIAFPLVSAVLAIPFIHVPGFLIGFPIPVSNLFNQQKVMATGVPIKMSAGIIRRNEIGIIMAF